MKINFMGTPDFAVGTLEALLGAGHEITLVVSQPDKPKGRGHELIPTPVKAAALAHNLRIYQPARLRDETAEETLRNTEADVIVVAAFGQLVPKSILEMKRYGCINVHGSLLPKYRGAAPIQWAVIDGEEKSGITIMQMEGLEAGALIPQKQGESPTAYAQMLTKEMGELNWSRPAKELECLIRGLNPWPSAYTRLSGKTLKIWDADVCEEGHAGKACGEIVRVAKDAVYVACGQGLLKINELQLQGKKRMDTAAFLRGYRLQEGTILG